VHGNQTERLPLSYKRYLANHFRDALALKGVPLIPLMPFFAAAIRRERQTGFLPPVLGTSSRKGVSVEVPFYWAISDSQDATLALEVFERRGVGAAGEYRYVLSDRQRGALNAFYVRETEQNNEDRGWAAFKHEWTLAPGLALKADLNGVSDDGVLEGGEVRSPNGQ